MGVAAQDNINPGHATRQLEIYIHSVVRKQRDGINFLATPEVIDELLKFVFPHTKGPVRHETLWMRDRNVREGLTDDGNTMVAHLFDDIRLEDAAGCGVKSLRVVERRLFCQKDVLCKKLAIEVAEVLAKYFFAVSKFKMPRHGLDAKQIGRLDHIGALSSVGQSTALPEIASIKQKRVPRRHRASQHINQCLEMREATQFAVTLGLLLEIEERKGVGFRATRRDPELLEETVAHEMWRLSLHGADANVYAWFAEKDRHQLSVGVRHV